MPPLPAARRETLAQASGLPVTESSVVIAVQRDLDALALATIAAGGDGKRVLTHVEHNLATEGSSGLDPATFAQLVALELGGQLTATQAKTVLAEMVASGRAPDVIASELGFEAMDSSELESVVDSLIAECPEEWGEFCTGDEKKRGKLQGFFTGKIMKATKGQADGKAVAALLEARRSQQP
jgi:aspartyl-tRNA(Asn)/glutamyl-tRNA(Gln) amidotransferase subunit B